MMKKSDQMAVKCESNAPLTLSKRIGSTTYKVSIRFSENATETMEDKVLRLIEREVGYVA